MVVKPMFALVPLLLAACATIPAGPTVKVTPLGTHAGELCNRDRAMIFEDPTGVRVLYDAGTSVLGGDDARLGAVHVVLLSHAHGDHMGDQRLTALGAGTCQSPTLATAAPNTTSAEIAASKNAGLVMINQMANFLGTRVEAIKGRPTAACPVGAAGDDHTVPFAASCLAGNNLGGTPNTMVLNLGLSAITMASGAYIANELIRPATVIISHPNEAASVGGKARPGSRTAELSGMLRSPVVLALSDRTMELDGQGRCVAGCS